MRSSVIAFAACASLLAGAARAQALQDRYDPPTQAAATDYALRGSQTPMLTWAGKVEPLRGAQSAREDLRGSAPLDAGVGHSVRGANSARYASASAPTATRAASLARISPASSESGAARLPTSLYDTAAGPAPAAQPASPIYAQPIPQAAPAPVSAPPAQAQTISAGNQSPHFYSLHREYGITPDRPAPAQPSILALSPTVATAMQDSAKDNSPTIDLAGEDQAQVAAPPRLRNANGTISTSSAQTSSTTNTDGATTTTYNYRN
jgi:hypothetical protein